MEIILQVPLITVIDYVNARIDLLSHHLPILRYVGPPLRRIIANKVMALEIPPDVGRVVMDGFKWTAARMNRAVYGDKTQLTGPNGDDPIQIESPSNKLRDVLNAQSKRIGGTGDTSE